MSCIFVYCNGKKGVCVKFILIRLLFITEWLRNDGQVNSHCRAIRQGQIEALNSHLTMF